MREFTATTRYFCSGQRQHKSDKGVTTGKERNDIKIRLPSEWVRERDAEHRTHWINLSHLNACQVWCAQKLGENYDARRLKIVF